MLVELLVERVRHVGVDEEAARRGSRAEITATTGIVNFVARLIRTLRTTRSSDISGSSSGRILREQGSPPFLRSWCFARHRLQDLVQHEFQAECDCACGGVVQHDARVTGALETSDREWLDYIQHAERCDREHERPG